MAATDRKHHSKCPFWSATSMKCSLCNGGIFIPLDDHMESFCNTSHYSACVQYRLHSENQTSLQEKVRKSEENRRKYMRVESSHEITLVKIFESDKPKSYISTSANTIDVSKGGMRLATEKALLHDMLVQFSFDESFPHILHEVTGQVEWCNKQVDEPGYQVGVSFQGDHIIEAMGRHLGQQYEQS
ncbi:MAG: PilZ domain-containing protein [Desulfobulbaceae bacterium]|nr:PilZ domain-containing protein [Desulfobulbaceae bacterium]